MLLNTHIPCFHCNYSVRKDRKNNLLDHHQRKHPNLGFNYSEKNAVAYYLHYGLRLDYTGPTCESFTVETLARIRETTARRRADGLRLCEHCLEN